MLESPSAETAKIIHGSRLENMRSFIEVMKNQPLSTTMLGRGLGFGTNTALHMNPNVSGPSTWVKPIDSTHVTFIVQFGLLGYAVLVFVVFSLIKAANKRLKKYEDKARLYVLAGMIFLLTLVQNVFENQLLVALCGIGIVFYIGKSAVNQIAINKEPGC